jgi:transposase
MSALNYSVNQERYLRTFLEHPEVPLDNNDAERSIKKFCVGKHSWHIIESKNGARASAMMYSIAETAKANGLNPFGYFQYLLDQLKEYPRNDVPDDKLKGLMPWSLSLPEYCKQQLKK